MIQELYRVVDEKNNGFYYNLVHKVQEVRYWWDNLSFCKDEDTIQYMIDMLHPLVPHKVRSSLYITQRYAFDNIDDMIMWFPKKIIQDVYRCKGAVLKLSIDTQYISYYKNQCIFDSEKVLSSSRMSFEEINELYKIKNGALA